MTYPAKRDWWVACVVVPSGLGLVGLGMFTAYEAGTQAMRPLPGLALAVATSGIGALLLRVFSTTSYEITATHLVARLGPFRWRIPLDAIEEVVTTNGFPRIGGVGLAWSLDALHVQYRKPAGRPAWPVSISPRDKAEFLRELAEAVPGLRVTGDGPGGRGPS